MYNNLKKASDNYNKTEKEKIRLSDKRRDLFERTGLFLKRTEQMKKYLKKDINRFKMITLIAIGISIYFLPAFLLKGLSIIAKSKKKRNGTAIFVLNLLAGWTFIGWIAALIRELYHDNQL